MPVEFDLWSYDTTLGDTSALDGYDVEAMDGSIGSVDEATTEARSSYIVVDTGPWIFGKKVLLPASVIDRVDVQDRKVHVRLTKQQIKDSPEFDEQMYRSPEYRDRVGTYYGSFFRAA